MGLDTEKDSHVSTYRLTIHQGRMALPPTVPFLAKTKTSGSPMDVVMFSNLPNTERQGVDNTRLLRVLEKNEMEIIPEEKPRISSG